MTEAEEARLAALAEGLRETGKQIEDLKARLAAAQAYQVAIQAAFAGLALALQERGQITGPEVADALRQVRESDAWTEQPNGAVCRYLDSLERILMTLKSRPRKRSTSTSH